MTEYYDWEKTLSYAADVSIVVASRGRGKTYGLRKQCIKDHLKDGSTFVEICRFRSELGPIMDGYFGRLADEFPQYIFKTEKQKGWIASKPFEDGDKPEWEVICYFIALTDSQNAKKRTYNNVKRLIFDEAILEAHDRYHRYLPREYTKLANIVDTATRERPETASKPHIYLLGNAVDIMNPFFQVAGINKMPNFGYKWYRNKTILLHYEDPGDYAEEKLKNTLSGRMTDGTAEGEAAARNLFETGSMDMIAKKPKNARFELGFMNAGKPIGIWADYKEGFYYVNDKIPKNTTQNIYYITREDATANYLAARRASTWMKSLSEAHYLNIIRYSSPAMMNNFLDMMAQFGL